MAMASGPLGGWVHAMGRRLAGALLAGMVGAWGGWALPAQAQPGGMVRGEAFYRERMALPPGAVFSAELQDVSLADAPARVIGRSTQEGVTAPPFRFEIPFPPEAAVPGHRYAVRATVTHQGRLLFTTDTLHTVQPGTDANLRLLMVSAAGRPAPGARAGVPRALGALPASFTAEEASARGPVQWHLDLFADGRYQLRTQLGPADDQRYDDLGRWRWERRSQRLHLRGERQAALVFQPLDGGITLQRQGGGADLRLQRQATFAPIEPRLPLSGSFVLRADAPRITLCADGRSLPVATEADFPALEAAYRKERRAAGEPLLVTVQALIAPRPSTEESRGAVPTLVVERFVRAWPAEHCSPGAADSPLRGTYWKLVRLGDEAVTPAPGRREAHMVLADDRLTVSGSGGCNRFTGAFEREGADGLRFSRLAGTMMACLDGEAVERSFFQALSNTRHFRIAGAQLELLDAQQQVLARLQAVALR